MLCLDLPEPILFLIQFIISLPEIISQELNRVPSFHYDLNDLLSHIRVAYSPLIEEFHSLTSDGTPILMCGSILFSRWSFRLNSGSISHKSQGRLGAG